MGRVNENSTHCGVEKTKITFSLIVFIIYVFIETNYIEVYLHPKIRYFEKPKAYLYSSCHFCVFAPDPDPQCQ